MALARGWWHADAAEPLWGAADPAQRLLCGAAVGDRVVTGTRGGHLYVWKDRCCGQGRARALAASRQSTRQVQTEWPASRLAARTVLSNFGPRAASMSGPMTSPRRLRRRSDRRS